ncbi:amino acid ABC transporter permease [Vibrio fluvialis]|jgi:polar amino acid transport system permease protein|uniref:amino acid ABC transporter permease n=1 Tax=Vibrio fluvialis TaxID=676 RepID=UPI00042A4055|nr:amino acid ABC transporter permease [Vibrio fluvialis]HDM8034224.1 amino acid ABC transporter permease [Vibrio fluvialis clinical-1]AVH34211.1 amino acid ABC transporter permease [Vibrio fluvialis]EKO3374410.1 amino acid ABC transporter permease [Vibrio fluvialis]EKO3375594.1 amino acid ABC transporter permease [Vibrio fluvialis]EKO3392879.1 amino acid ABC transporter permease [Vibrio fluvialis]
MMQFTDWDIFRSLLMAARWTVALSLIAFVGGGLLGLFITLLRSTRHSVFTGVIKLYVELFQGTPLLMQLFLAFFGLSLVGVEVSAWTAAVLSLTLFSSAFFHDIWRGCIESLPKGQWEACRTLGLSYLQTMRYIIAPQAARLAIAPTVGFSVQIVKGTALASIIGFVELTKAGTMLNNATFQPFKVFALVALLYFAICFPLSALARYLETRNHVAR